MEKKVTTDFFPYTTDRLRHRPKISVQYEEFPVMILINWLENVVNIGNNFP